MRSVALSEAKDRLSEFVAAAEAGEEIVITRHGKARAKLVSINDDRSSEQRAQAAWERLKTRRDRLRAENRTATMEEFIEWKNEGRP